MKKITHKNANITLNVSDVDTVSGVVKLYASAFDNLDSDGDIMERGSFAKSIAERGVHASTHRKIVHLVDHEWTNLIGKPIEMMEDEKGLIITSKISQTTKGKDTIQLYMDGVLDQHSVGGYVEQFEETNEGRIIKEFNLWEYSSVTFGANPDTPMLGIKGVKDSESYIDQLVKKSNNIQQVLKKGSVSDETCYLLEGAIIQISADIMELKSLLENEPPPSTQIEKEPIDQKREFYLNYLK